MSVLFCRHGETIFNKEDRFQGVSDSSLTEKGVEQSKRIGEFLRSNFHPEKVLTSPLPRVIKTMDIALEGVEVTRAELAELREVCYGSWEGKDKASLKLLPEWKVRQQDRFHFVHPGAFHTHAGESYAQLYQRLEPFLKECASFSEKIIVCAHIGVLRCVVKYYNGLTDKEAGELEIKQSLVFLLSDNKKLESINLEEVAKE